MSLGRALAVAVAAVAVVPAKYAIDYALEDTSPTTIIIATLAAWQLVTRAYNTYQNWDSEQVKHAAVEKVVKFAMWTPVVGPRVVKPYIENKVTKDLLAIKEKIDAARKQFGVNYTLPERGMSEEEILKRFENLGTSYHEGKLSGAVYTKHHPQFRAMLEKIWGMTELTNPMHMDWPLIHVMRAEIISWCQNLLGGKSGAHGVVTHGGTTSIIEACLAYVAHARKNGIEHPEIIVPETAHVAFDKAADILNVKLVKVPVDKKTGKADIAAMEKKINANTCMMVGSAPSFPYGIMDPILDLARVAKNKGVPFHVDGCLGGFLTAFAMAAGFPLPHCDFSVPGVTSISFDTHKYGETPKGTSVLLFSPNCKATPSQVYLDWIGGLYVTDTMDGSRSGADIATTWATLAYKGKEYYVESTKKILTLQRELAEALKKIDGLEIAYEPMLSVVGIRTKPGINPALVAQKFKENHWNVSMVQTKSSRFLGAVPTSKVEGFHFCITAVHTDRPGFLQEFVSDISAAVAYAKAHPQEKPTGMEKAYGALEEGKLPKFLHQRIGDGFAKIINAVAGKDIPGVYEAPKLALI